jgi:pimeloyl-CoA synthetase
MFLLIALYQIVSRNRSTTWDGTVVDKKVEKKRRFDKYQDRWIEFMKFTVSIKADSGKIFDLSAEDDDTIYNYYKISDRVRHHKGLNSYEKRDKEGDTIIFCNACASLNDIKDDYCFRCACPLLK